MKYEQYISLIKRLEIDAKEKPAFYRLKVMALAVLGYAYILGIIFVPVFVVLALLGAFWIKPALLLILLKFLGKLLLVLLVFIGGIFTAFFGAIKSFFKEIVKPKGIRLTREIAPAIFDTVDEISAGVNAPKPDQILINDDFNASVMTVPRYGFLGNKTYLNIGLPLMEAVSPNHFRAILAHEMGHISKGHGSNAAWIYQLRETWSRFLENQEETESSSIDFLYTSFVNWYFPYFNAYSFVLAREQEREADKMAAELYGAKDLAESLIFTEVKGAFLGNEYWKKIFDIAKGKEKPPSNVFSDMQRAFRSESDPGKEALALSKALKTRTDFSDTHPSLNERLQALGYPALVDGAISKLPANFETTAAEEYVGDYAERWAKDFDREWKNEILPFWKMSYEHWGEARKRTEELDLKYQTKEITEDEMYELAELHGSDKGEDAAIPILEEILKTNPKHVGAKYSLGSILLDSEDERGVELLKESMLIDRTITIPVCESIYAFYFSQHREDEALRYLRKADSFVDIIEAAQVERQNVTNADDFQPHKVDPKNVEHVIKILSYHEEIERAYLVKKRVEYLQEEALNVLGIQTKKNMLGRSVGVSDDDLLEVIVEQVAPLDVHFVMVLGKQFKATKKKMKQIDMAMIYEAKNS